MPLLALQPAYVDLRVQRGDHFSMPVVIKDDSAPVDCTGWTFAGQVRTRGGNSLVASFNVVTTNADDGEIIFQLNPEHTASLAPGIYHYDLQYVNSGGIKRTFVAGRFDLILDATLT